MQGPPATKVEATTTSSLAEETMDQLNLRQPEGPEPPLYYHSAPLPCALSLPPKRTCPAGKLCRYAVIVPWICGPLPGYSRGEAATIVKPEFPV